MLALHDRSPDQLRPIREVQDIADYAGSSDAPDIGFHRLVPRGRSPIRAPLFLLGDAAAANLTPLFTQTVTPELGCYGVRDAAIAPSGIVIKDDVAFSSLALLHPPHLVAAVADRLNATALPLRYVPGPVAVIDGPGHETWGHWLTDFLPRLAVLSECGWDIGTLRFVVPDNLMPFAFEMLRLCGIGPDRLIVNRHWHTVLTTDLLLMPTALRYGDRLSQFFAEATRFWQRRLRLRLDIPARSWPTRLFLSRGGTCSARVLLNREDLEHEATRRGLAVVRPETLSFAEQICLFQSARVVVGEYGSALHNTVFSEPGTLACGLRGTAQHPGFYQSGIATALDQEMAYVFGATPEQDVEQCFTIRPESFHQAMDILDCA